jgi:hypothetical protein
MESKALEKKLDVVACLLGCLLLGKKGLGDVAIALDGIGLGAKEISAVLGANNKAVENALYKARKKAK